MREIIRLGHEYTCDFLIGSWIYPESRVDQDVNQ